MNRLDSLISGTVAISLLLFSLSTQGADSPQATIQAAVQRTFTPVRTLPTRDLLIARTGSLKPRG